MYNSTYPPNGEQAIDEHQTGHQPPPISAGQMLSINGLFPPDPGFPEFDQELQISQFDQMQQDIQLIQGFAEGQGDQWGKETRPDLDEHQRQALDDIIQSSEWMKMYVRPPDKS